MQGNPNYKWVILVINFIFLAFSYAGLSTWAIAVFDLSITFSLTPAMVQLGSSMLMAGYAVGSFAESFIAARVGLKKTGLFAALLLLIPQFTIPFVPSYGLILFLRFVQGWGIVWFVTTSMAASWFPVEQRGMASGIVGAGIPFGIGIGGIFAGQLSLIVNTWQNTFIVFGVITLVVVTVWAILAKDPIAEKIETTITGSSPAAKANPLKLLAGWLVAFCLFANAWQFIGFNTVLPSYMFTLGYGPSEAGIAIFFVGLIGVISTPLGGIISDKMIKKGWEPVKARAYTMAVPGFLVAAAASFLFPFAAKMGYAQLLLIAIAAGWGIPLTNACIGALPTDMLKDPNLAGKLFGLTIFVGISGGVIAPFAVSSIGGAMGWHAAFAALGIGALAGVLLGLIIPKVKS